MLQRVSTLLSLLPLFIIVCSAEKHTGRLHKRQTYYYYDDYYDTYERSSRSTIASRECTRYNNNPYQDFCSYGESPTESSTTSNTRTYSNDYYYDKYEIDTTDIYFYYEFWNWKTELIAAAGFDYSRIPRYFINHALIGHVIVAVLSIIYTIYKRKELETALRYHLFKIFPKPTKVSTYKAEERSISSEGNGLQFERHWITVDKPLYKFYTKYSRPPAVSCYICGETECNHLSSRANTSESPPSDRRSSALQQDPRIQTTSPIPQITRSWLYSR